MRFSDWIQTCALPICAPRLVEGRLHRGDPTGVAVGDRDAAEGAPRDHVGPFLARRQRLVEQVVEAGGEAMRPAVDADRHNVARRIEIGSGERACGELARSEEHTSELQYLMRIQKGVFCLKQTKNEQR